MRIAGRIWLCVALAALLLYGAPRLASAQTFPPRPGDLDFTLDQANLIDPSDEDQIRSVCQLLLKDRQIPMIVVTIPSLARYRALDIEQYARALFDNWGIGSRENNYGILLLVSLGDRKARIELGAAWAFTKDATAQMIMQDIIIPNFKQGNYSAGILQGVQALDTMARGRTVRKPVPAWYPWAILGGLVLLIAAGVSLIRSGRKGWGWALLAVAGTILVVLLFAFLRGGGRRGSGRSFGGGFGGGGGATGSW